MSVFMKNSLLQMRLRQAWPKTETKITFMFYFKFFALIALCSHFWLGLLLHLIVVLKNRLDVGVSADISVLTSCIGLHFMIIMFVVGHRKIANLFQNMNDFSKFGKPDNFDRRARQLNLYSKLYSAYCCLGLCGYTLIQILEIPECRRMNIEKHLNEVCGLVVPIWAPFNVDYFPLRHFLLIFQMFSVFITINGGAAQSFTTLEVANCIVYRIRHFRRLLDDYIVNHSERKRDDFIYCIKYHHLQNLFDGRYRYCNGSYVFMVGIVIAGLCNQYMKERNPGAIIHLVGWLISFFMASHAGQIVITESTKVADGIYNSNWYETPVSLQRDLLVIIIRAQQSLVLHASPVGIMSYELFIKLLKTSSSYFALLKQST